MNVDHLRRRDFLVRGGIATAGAATVLAVTTGVESAIASVYDVSQGPYNAPGDGSDQTAAIQAALDDAVAAGGGTVYLPAGHYGISDTLTVAYQLPYADEHSVNLRGDGPRATYLHHTGASNTPILDLFYVNAPSTTGAEAWSTVSDLAFVSGSYPAGGIQSAIGLRIRELLAVTVRNVLAGLLDVGIHLDSSIMSRIENCQVASNHTGVRATIAPNAIANHANVITGCAFSANQTWGIDFDGGSSLRIDQCVFSYNGAPESEKGSIHIGPTIEGGPALVHTIRECYFEANLGRVIKVDGGSLDLVDSNFLGNSWTADVNGNANGGSGYCLYGTSANVSGSTRPVYSVRNCTGLKANDRIDIDSAFAVDVVTSRFGAVQLAPSPAVQYSRVWP